MDSVNIINMKKDGCYIVEIDSYIFQFNSYTEAWGFAFKIICQKIEERKDLFLYEKTVDGLIKTNCAGAADIVMIASEEARQLFNISCDLDSIPRIQELGWFIWNLNGDSHWDVYDDYL